MSDNDPTVLGLLVDGQARIEAALNTGLAEFRGEIRGLTSRVEKLERDRLERSAGERAAQEHVARVWTRREKAVGIIAGVLMLGSYWFAPLVQNALTGHH